MHFPQLTSRHHLSYWISGIFGVYTKCYEQVGCFSTGGEFSNFLVRPIQFLPLDPRYIHTSFLLLPKNKTKEVSFLETNNDKLFKRAQLNVTEPLVFLIHGFLQSASEHWVKVRRHHSFVEQVFLLMYVSIETKVLSFRMSNFNSEMFSYR